MPKTLAGTSINHESDSEEDLDYVPEGEGHGNVHTQACSWCFTTSHIRFQTLTRLMSVARNVLALKCHHSLTRI